MGQNNEKIRGWIRLLWPIVLALLLVAVAYGGLRFQVGNNTQTNEKQQVKIEAHDTAITKISTQLEHITKGIDRIEGKLDE